MIKSILNVNEPIIFDESILSAEYHTYQPYASNLLNNNDEIRVSIQKQDLLTLPFNSFIYVEGQLLTHDNKPATQTKFINNGILYLFDEIRYEVGGIIVDRIRNPGITTTLKNYVSYTPNESKLLEISGWSPQQNALDYLVNNKGNFSVCIPLKMILGFAEDYQKIIKNLKQDLVLLRSSTDLNAIISSENIENAKVKLLKVQWRIQHISPADREKLKLLKYIENDVSLSVSFRGWELHEYPVLPQAQQHTWVVKTASQLEKPRYIIFGFQTNRKNNLAKNMSHFDHCSLINIKAELNSEIYPYDNLNLNFENNQWSLLYYLYAHFQKYYYDREYNEPLFSPSDFKEKCPIVVIDTSRQNETLKSGAVDLKINFETYKNIP